MAGSQSSLIRGSADCLHCVEFAVETCCLFVLLDTSTSANAEAPTVIAHVACACCAAIAWLQILFSPDCYCLVADVDCCCLVADADCCCLVAYTVLSRTSVVLLQMLLSSRLLLSGCGSCCTYPPSPHTLHTIAFSCLIAVQTRLCYCLPTASRQSTAALVFYRSVL